MSKLVINTQYRENYAACNEDFVEGVSTDHWKFKGGSTYVVENVTPAQATKIGVHGIPHLKALIEYSNPASEEYILDYEVVEDDNASVCEEWETPTIFAYDSEIKEWRGSKVTINGDMGYMKSEIKVRTESWIVRSEIGREDYSVQFLMNDGDVVSYAGLSDWFDANSPVEEVA